MLWVDNIEMDLGEVGWGDLAQDTEYVEGTEMDLQVPQNARNFLSS
jgi:hypothetical protein